MDGEKSEMIILPKKQGNACGGKDHRVLIFQRRETHE